MNWNRFPRFYISGKTFFSINFKLFSIFNNICNTRCDINRIAKAYTNSEEQPRNRFCNDYRYSYIIKNNILQVTQELDDETLLKLNILLNTHLNGLTMGEINLGMIAAMKQQAGIHSDIVSEVIDAVAEAMKEDEDLEIYTSGTNNIFRYPELADQQKASELISTFEEKNLLSELVQETLSDESNTGIQVYIGEEMPLGGMKDCSLVTATYELEEGMKGTIGIIGPKRMDYDKVVGTLQTLKNQLDELYKKT